MHFPSGFLVVPSKLFMILVIGPLWTWCVPPVKGKMSQVES